MSEQIQSQSPDVQSAVWTIDPSHTLVEFSVKHMMFATVRGRFGKVEGTIKGDPNDLTTGSTHVTIEAASVETHETDRDNHLRSPDFFDTENHPNITFTSQRIERRGGADANRYTATGDLTIRGITHPVTLDVTYNGRGKDPWGQERIGLSADTVVDRKDFDLTWNTLLEAGGVLVSDEVRITLEVQAIRQA